MGSVATGPSFSMASAKLNTIELQIGSLFIQILDLKMTQTADAIRIEDAIIISKLGYLQRCDQMCIH